MSGNPMRTIGEIVAVVGVLLGLVFVGLETGQNNQLAEAAAYQATPRPASASPIPFRDIGDSV